MKGIVKQGVTDDHQRWVEIDSSDGTTIVGVGDGLGAALRNAWELRDLHEAELRKAKLTT